SRLETLGQDLAQLRGKVDALANQIDAVDKRSHALYLYLDTRLKTLEAAAAPPKDATGAEGDGTKGDAKKDAKADAAEKDKQDMLEKHQKMMNDMAALQNQLQNELRQSQSKGVMDAYAAAIKNKVQAQWYKPPGWEPQWQCNVRISQASDGTVINVKVLQCDGDQLFQRSVQQAIERASPLPLPSDMSLFQSSINFTFQAKP
ncbi:MAG: protein TolA, partial [Halothiobacillus sp. 20-54-6]